MAHPQALLRKMLAEQFGKSRIILDNQQLRSSSFRWRLVAKRALDNFRGRTRLRLFTRKRDEKCAAFAIGALCPRTALMHLHDLLHQRQSQSGAGDAATFSALHPVELVEKVWQGRCRNAHAMVGHPNHYLLALGARPNDDLSALRGIFQRIRDEVVQHFVHSFGIGADRRQL